MAGVEDCSGSCGSQTRTLERKITQALMEVLVEEEWIWWNAEKGQAATASGKAATALRGRGSHHSKSWRSKPARRRGRGRFCQLVKIYSGKNTGPVRLLLQSSGGVCHGGYFLLPNRE
jgi:hypothetical protein